MVLIMITYKHSEQADKSETITIWLSNGISIDVKQDDVLNWIERRGMNISLCGTGLVSDPNGTEYESEVSAESVLDDNFDGVMEKYYLDVLNK